MLNIVADKEGVGAAVLIRSCAPIAGILLFFQIFKIYVSINFIVIGYV